MIYMEARDEKYFTIFEQTIHTVDSNKSEEIENFLKKYKIGYRADLTIYRPKPILFIFIIFLVVATLLTYQNIENLLKAYALVLILYAATYVNAKYRPIMVKER